MCLSLNSRSLFRLFQRTPLLKVFFPRFTPAIFLLLCAPHTLAAPPSTSLTPFLLPFIQIDWTEPWLQALIGFHLLCFIVIVATRHILSFQAVLGTALTLLVFSAERLNEQAALHWQCVPSPSLFCPRPNVFVRFNRPETRWRRMPVQYHTLSLQGILQTAIL